jgi:hypothetical protein
MASFVVAAENLAPVTSKTFVNQYDHEKLIGMISEDTLRYLTENAEGGSKPFDFSLLKNAFIKLWGKFLGDNILSQSVANVLFELFVKNAPKAETALLEWFQAKTGIAKEAIDEVVIQRINAILRQPEGEKLLIEYLRNYFKVPVKTWLERVWVAVKRAIGF